MSINPPQSFDWTVRNLHKAFNKWLEEVKLFFEFQKFEGEGRDSVAEPISMSTPQMNYVNENSQNNRKEQRQGNNNNKWQFICRIYKRVCKCPWRLYVVFS